MPVEVSVISQDGIPEDALFSIRAGSTRRQAAMTCGKPYRFPKIGIEESPVKIDILQTIGTAYLVVKPGEERYQAIFQGKNASEMSCEVEFRNVDGPPAAEPEAKDTGGDPDDAKAYLEKHKILTFVQAVLQTVIKEKPEDPYAHIARHFTCGYDPIDERGPVMTRRFGATTQGYGFTATAPVGQAAVPSAAPVPTLAPAAPGAAAQEAAPATAPEPEPAKAALEAAAEKPAAAEAAAEPAVGDNAPRPAPAGSGGDVDAFRRYLRETLEEAHMNGVLSNALAEAEANQKTELASLRSRTRGTLQEAASDGVLTLKLEAFRPSD